MLIIYQHICIYIAQPVASYNGEYVLLNELNHGADANVACQIKFGTNAATIYSIGDNNKAVK